MVQITLEENINSANSSPVSFYNNSSTPIWRPPANGIPTGFAQNPNPLSSYYTGNASEVEACAHMLMNEEMAMILTVMLDSCACSIVEI